MYHYCGFSRLFWNRRYILLTSTLFEWMNIKLCSERWAFRSFFKIMNVDNSLKDGIFQSGKFSKFLQSIFSLLKAKLSSIVDLKGKNKKCKLNKTKKSCPKFSLLLKVALSQKVQDSFFIANFVIINIPFYYPKLLHPIHSIDKLIIQSNTF